MLTAAHRSTRMRLVAPVTRDPAQIPGLTGSACMSLGCGGKIRASSNGLKNAESMMTVAMGWSAIIDTFTASPAATMADHVTRAARSRLVIPSRMRPVLMVGAANLVNLRYSVPRRQRTLTVLRRCIARIGKVGPPLTRSNARRSFSASKAAETHAKTLRQAMVASLLSNASTVPVRRPAPPIANAPR